VTEPAAPETPSPPRPVPDLGFFAGPSSRGTSAFGGAPVAAPPSSPAAGNRFDGAAGNQFGSATAAPFGAAAPLAPFGLDPGVPTGPNPRSSVSTVAVVAVVVGLLVLVLAVTGGRFGWRHFLADPVVPDTLQGMPLITDPSFEAGTRAAQDSVAKDLTAGSKAEIGLYSDGQGLGYMLFALRGSSRPGQGNGDDELKNAPKTTHGNVECYAMPSAPGAVAATMCMRSFFRRAVLVMAFGVTRPDPAMVARATDEAWKAQ